MNSLASVMTRINLSIIALIAQEELSLREIAEKVGCSPGKVHHAISLFKKQGMVTLEKRKNRIIPKPNREHALYQKVKALINTSMILDAEAYKQLVGVAAIGIYGSYAQGTDDASSDVDLILITNKRELEIREHIRNLEREIGKRVSPLIVTKKKLKQLEKADKEFYIRLKLTAVILNGDIFG